MANFLEMFRPQNAEQLRGLFDRFGGFLSPENQQMVQGIITEIEKGEGQMDMDRLRAAANSISQQMQGAGVNLNDANTMTALQQAFGQQAVGNYYDEYDEEEDPYDDEYEYDYDEIDEDFRYINDYNDYFNSKKER